MIFKSREAFVKWANHFKDTWDWSNPLEVTAEESKLSRSGQQRKLQWLWMGELEKQSGTNTEALHRYFKEKYAVPIFRRDDSDYNEMIQAAIELQKTGDKKNYLKIKNFIVDNTSTTDFNTKQMSDYLNMVYLEATTEWGYQLSDPALHGLEWMNNCRDH